MDGDYKIRWTALSATGEIHGKFEQTIYAKDFQGAILRFVEFCGELGPDEEGDVIEINLVQWGECE